MAERVKMERSERAKQFMPFAALKGYRELLASKERVVVAKNELSEEYKEELDRKLKQVKIRDMITVIYYADRQYIKKTGMVSKIDESARILKIVETKISFDDIYDLSGDGIEECGSCC